MILHTPSKSGDKRKSLRRSVGLMNLDVAANGDFCEQESPLSRTPSRKRHQPVNESMIRYWRSNVVNNASSPLDLDDHPGPAPTVDPRASTVTITQANVSELSVDSSDWKTSKPHQAAFNSSGLVSKTERSRPVTRQMPETPCKRRPESLIFDFEDRPDSSRLLWNSPFAQVTNDVQNFSLHSPTRPLTSTPAPSKAQRLVSDASTITPCLGLRRPGLSLAPPRSSPPAFNRTPHSPTVNTSASFTFASPRQNNQFSSCDSTFDYDDVSRDSYATADTSVESVKALFDDTLLHSRFSEVNHIGTGEFSSVWSVKNKGTKRFAVKRSKKIMTGARQRTRRYEEVEILRALSPRQEDNIVALVDAWEEQGYLYIMTEFCENGSLDAFLSELGTRLDEWRVWKILHDITTGVRFIHDRQYCHLDLKPANIFITFEGTLKIGDFGMATSLPAAAGTEREGDREYIAPEVLRYGHYDTPADMFSLGIMMVEVAANIILPDNGEHWHKLRSGDLSDAGRLSSGDLQQAKNGEDGPPQWAPYFMVNGSQALDRIVKSMLNPEPKYRPTAASILAYPELQLVDARRQAGAIVYEGNYGPEPESWWEG